MSFCDDIRKVARDVGTVDAAVTRFGNDHGRAINQLIDNLMLVATGLCAVGSIEPFGPASPGSPTDITANLMALQVFHNKPTVEFEVSKIYVINQSALSSFNLKVRIGRIPTPGTFDWEALSPELTIVVGATVGLVGAAFASPFVIKAIDHLAIGYMDDGAGTQGIQRLADIVQTQVDPTLELGSIATAVEAGFAIPNTKAQASWNKATHGNVWFCLADAAKANLIDNWMANV